MKFFQKTKKVLCLFLAASLLTISLAACSSTKKETGDDAGAASGTSTPPVNYTQTPTSVKKAETVYVSMDALGNPLQTTVSDWLHTDQENVRVEDKTDLSNIQNLKDDSKPLQNGENLTWNVTGTDLYYQGTSDKPLPVKLQIAYWLDGKEMKPEELAGKSGSLKMTLKFINKESRTVTINGKQTTMYVPAMAVGGMVLPEDVYQNTKIEGGAVIGDGSKQMAVLLSVPGLEESLNLKGSGIQELADFDFPSAFTLTADVKNFQMGNMMFALTTDIPELEGMDNITQLADIKTSLTQLKKMQDSVKGMDPDGVLEALFTDPRKVKSLQTLSSSLFQLDELDTSIVKMLANYVTHDNIDLIQQIRHHLQEANLVQLMSDPAVLNLLNQLGKLDVKNGSKLIQDIERLQNLDPTGLKKVLHTLSGLLPTVKAAVKATDAFSGNTQNLQTLSKLPSLGLEAIDLLAQADALSKALEQAGIHMTPEGMESMLGAMAKQAVFTQAGASASLSAEQIQRLTYQKAEYLLTAIVNNNFFVPAEHRDDAAACLALAAQEDPSLAAQQASLLQKVQSGTLNASDGNIVKEAIDAALAQVSQAEKTAGNLAAQLAPQVASMASGASNLTAQVNAIGQQAITDALQFAQTGFPALKELMELINNNKESIDALLKDQDVQKYLSELIPIIVDLGADLAANQNNLQAIQKILGSASSLLPELQAFAKVLVPLSKDLKTAAPLLARLLKDMDDPDVIKSLAKSPETLATLLKMEGTLKANGDILSALKKIATPQNITSLGGVLGQLNGLMSAGGVDGYLDLAAQADELLARVQKYLSLGQDYGLYTKAADGMETSVAFVLKTAEIMPAKQAAADNSSQKKSLKDKAKSLFNK